MRAHGPRWLCSCVILAAFCAGCSSDVLLVATPNIALVQQGHEIFEKVPPERMRPEIDLIYAADRAVSPRKKLFGVDYGAGRSGYLVFGEVTVGVEPDFDWDGFVEKCETRSRRMQIRLELDSVVQLGELALPIRDMEVRDGRYRVTQADVKRLAAGRDALHKLLAKQLSLTASKDVYLFVHGFNNTFSEAVIRMAQLWHFMGRQGVAIAYTWPAGRGGLTGYAYDRESGEFTIYHLKKFLQAIASCPEVERVHLIAHSRGTDVLVTALRELHIDCKARGVSTQQEFKIENVVLAAPDLDADVFEQRYAVEDLHLAAKRTTIYLSKADLALSLSNWLFGGNNRLGSLEIKQFTSDARTKLAELKSFYMIDCNVSGYSTSHDYAFAHPAVLSDMILLLRDNRDPGAENGRPLRAPYDGVWQISNDYLLPQK